MVSSLQQQWHDITHAKPGRRFRNRYYQRKQRRSNGLVKALYLLVGAGLFLVGIILLPAPGPGFLVIFVGAGLMAEESLLVARALDRTERKARALASAAKRGWKHASAALKGLLVASGAAFAAAAGFAAYAVLFH